MRAPRVGIVSMLLAGAAAGGCAAKSPPQVFGRSVTLVPQGGAPKVRGELLAVDDRHVYVRTRDGVSEVELASVKEALVQRHSMTPRKAFLWGTIGASLSGIGLTAACASVEGNDVGGCARVGGIAAGIWLGMSAIAAASFSSSANLPVAPWDKALRPFARFPAGLPKDVPPQALVAGPPAPR